MLQLGAQFGLERNFINQILALRKLLEMGIANQVIQESKDFLITKCMQEIESFKPYTIVSVSASIKNAHTLLGSLTHASFTGLITTAHRLVEVIGVSSTTEEITTHFTPSTTRLIEQMGSNLLSVSALIVEMELYAER